MGEIGIVPPVANQMHNDIEIECGNQERQDDDLPTGKAAICMLRRAKRRCEDARSTHGVIFHRQIEQYAIPTVCNQTATSPNAKNICRKNILLCLPLQVKRRSRKGKVFPLPPAFSDRSRSFKVSISSLEKGVKSLKIMGRKGKSGQNPNAKGGVASGLWRATEREGNSPEKTGTHLAPRWIGPQSDGVGVA